MDGTCDHPKCHEEIMLELERRPAWEEFKDELDPVKIEISKKMTKNAYYGVTTVLTLLIIGWITTAYTGHEERIKNNTECLIAEKEKNRTSEIMLGEIKQEVSEGFKEMRKDIKGILRQLQ